MSDIFIFDNSRVHRLKLEKIVRGYIENNNIKIGDAVLTDRPNKILKFPLTGARLYFLNIDDLEKTMDGIKFALNIRNNDFAGSIVFLTEHDIFATGRSDLAVRSLRSRVAAMSFLAKDSAQYENQIKECIDVHIRKISSPISRNFPKKMCPPLID